MRRSPRHPGSMCFMCPGGFGQEGVMEDEEVLGWIGRQAAGARCIFSVCTGALHLRRGGPAAGAGERRRTGRHFTCCRFRRDSGQRTGRRRRQLDIRRRRHGRDRWRIAAGGRAARRRRRAQAIQLHMEYAPEPPFDSGTPETRRPLPSWSEAKQCRRPTSPRNGKRPRGGWRRGSAMPPNLGGKRG